MSRTNRITYLLAILLAVCVQSGLAQDIVPLEDGRRGVCATSLLSDPRTVHEAWLNTQLRCPGIVEAMRQWSLLKGTQDPRAGDQNLFWVYNIQNKIYDTVRAELKAVGTLCYIWVAFQEWNNGHVTGAEVNEMLDALERFTGSSSLDSTKGILQIDRQVYGDPPNIDASFRKGKGDGKTHFLICDIKDGWTGAGNFVAGFFFSVDVDPNSGAAANSNKRDILYIDSYPGIFNNGIRRTNLALKTLAHEFQHLIHWNYDPYEITFFNEGLSQYAEFLCGYNLDGPALYFRNTDVTLTGWENTSNVLDDYSRSTLWTRYIAEQYGLRFIKNFVQNPSTGIQGFDQSLGQTGYATNFATTIKSFFTANWLGSNAQDSAYRYKSAPGGRPSLKGDYTDPNVQRVDTVVQQGVQYISFASARNFRVTFNAPAGVTVRAIESGPTSLRIRDVANGVEFTSPELGTQFSSVVFAVMNTQPVDPRIYSYTAAGELLRFIVEESYDSGTPHPFSQGYAPYLGFGNNSATLGMAVHFQPAVKGSILRKARMMVAFDQEFSNGTALPTDSKNLVFHVWGDRSGRPGADIIPPFLVSVDRNLYPYGSFVDIDLSAHERALTNLKGPIYIGFMEDVNDSVGTYMAVDNFTPDDYSYVYRGPNHRDFPNTWQTLREVSALPANNHKLDGFNLMIRAVFEYSDSSSAPTVTLGYLQNPLLSEYVDVVAACPDELRPGSLSGTFTQTGGTTPLRFYNIPETYKAFIDTTQQLKGSGAASLKVRAAKRYGIFYSDTTVTFNARLLKKDEPATVSTPSGTFTVAFDAGSVGRSLYVTAFDGVSNPGIVLPHSQLELRTFSLGPLEVELSRPSVVRISNMKEVRDVTLAMYREGKWIAVPSTLDEGTGELMATIKRLGVFGIVKRNEVEGQVETAPTQFALYQSYPNPFSARGGSAFGGNPSTTIEFAVPRTSRVQLIVYDVLGKEVVRLADEERAAGHYAVKLNAAPMPSGVYFYRLSAEGLSQVRKFVVVK